MPIAPEHQRRGRARSAGEKVGRPRNSKASPSSGSAAISPISPSETAVPRQAAENGHQQRLHHEGPMTWRGLAPSAIFTPISRVRSLTTAYMMLATPMPPDDQRQRRR